MAVRQPVAAGRFYPAGARELERQARSYLGGRAEKRQKPFAVMAPHAGYVYSGQLAGMALSGTDLGENVIILCPNHSGLGLPLGVWPCGEWLTPLGPVPVNEALAGELAESGGGFAPDTRCHLREHSAEVLLPFLQAAGGAPPSIVPVCVGTGRRQELRAAGQALARVLSRPIWRQSTGILISSDMNHYEDLATTIAKDRLALERLAACDADGLLDTVAGNSISMCGAAPAALALYAARELGSARCEIVAHDTSATASGDESQVVGYAAARFFVEDRA